MRLTLSARFREERICTATTLKPSAGLSAACSAKANASTAAGPNTTWAAFLIARTEQPCANEPERDGQIETSRRGEYRATGRRWPVHPANVSGQARQGFLSPTSEASRQN